MNRIAIDVGGTFTDFMVLDEVSGKLSIAKYLTTPGDPSVGVMEGIDRMIEKEMIDSSETGQVIHGTTFPNNLIIERKGAKTALITTDGFRDVLEIARIKRYELYDLFIDKPVPLVPRSYIRGVIERIDYEGNILIPINKDGVEQLLEELMKLGTESIAVCLLHAYANPTHEISIKRIIENKFPEISVSLSSEVSPKYKEYERTSTTVANAYLMKGVARYIRNLHQQLEDRGLAKAMYIMQSNGGIASSSTVEKYPVNMLESGPAAGAQAAAYLGKLMGYKNLLSFDMGGTTAKMCPIVEGEPKLTDEFEIEKIKLRSGSGLPINIPAIDMIEIGAGGGSIANIKRELIEVGPESAGALPGPMCYQRGGQEPTVTDANLILGYLNPEFFAGGEINLDRSASIAGVQSKIAQPLGLSIELGAWGVHEIVNANMARAMRVVTIERGYDPRKFMLVAFGGAGPVHGSRLARMMGIKKVVIPICAGVVSALGLLVSDPRFYYSHTFIRTLEGETITEMRRIYNGLESQGMKSLESCGLDGVFKFFRSCGMRYVGQGFEINIQVQEKDLNDLRVETLKMRFNEEYERNYGYAVNDAEIEVVTLKLIATCIRPQFSLQTMVGKAKCEDPKKGTREIYFPETNGFQSCSIYDRDKLYPGFKIQGPAIVEERTSSTVVLPGDLLEVDEFGSLLITTE